MVSIVKSNQIINYIILLPYTIAIRIHSLLHPQLYQTSESDTISAKFVLNLLGHSPIVHSIISLLLIYLCGVLIAQMANSYRIFQRQNLYPAYFFVILASLTSELQILSPALLAVVFFVLFISCSLMIYRKALTGTEIFNVGALAVLSALLYPPFTILILVAFFTVIFFIGIEIKSFLKVIMGSISILIISSSLFFYLGHSPFSNNSLFGFSDSLFLFEYWTFNRVALLVTNILISIIALLKFYGFLKKKVIDARKRISYIYLCLAALMLTPLLFINTDIYFILGLSVTSAVFIGLFLDSFRNSVPAELTQLILLVILFSIQFNLFPI